MLLAAYMLMSWFKKSYETTDPLTETLSFSKMMSEDSFLLPQKNVILFRYKDKLHKIRQNSTRKRKCSRQ